MSFTTPILLAGLGLLTLPLIAHFLQRHSTRRVVFPTVQFLMAAVATQSRFHRLKRWLLLLLRLIAVACIVLAFTRPVWLDVSETDAATRGQSTSVVLLVDRSASTGRRSGGVTGIESLRAAAGRTLDSLRSGTDVANIVFADAQPDAVFDRMSPNLPVLRQELDQLAPSEERADFPAAVALAGRFLAERNGPKRLVVISDLQASNWNDALTEGSLGQLLPPDTVVTVAETGERAPGNISLSDPRHFPAQPLAGQECELTVRVNNFGTQPAQVRVSLETETAAGESAIRDQTISLEAGEDRDVTFDATAPQSGPLLATFSAPADALIVDNRACLVVRTSDRIPVLIVSDDSPDDPGTTAFYTLRALSPRGDNTDRFDARHVRPLRLTRESLAGVSAVFVGYLGDVSEATARVLVDYIDGGGGVVWFCGEGPVVRNLETLQTAAGDREILPWNPGIRREIDPRGEPLHISSGRWQSRWFREFDEQSQIAIAQISFRRVWSVAAPHPETDVLLSFSNGQPALGSRLFGQGQLLVANFSPSVGESDFGKHGAFVAWTQIVAQSLMPGVVTAQATPPGVAYHHRGLIKLEPGERSVVVTGPDDSVVAAAVTARGDGMQVEIANPQAGGIYRFESGGTLIDAAAINVDPREGNLASLSAERVSESLSRQGLRTDTRQTAGWDSVLNLDGEPMWGLFFTLALCAIGLELLLLGWWKR